MIKQFRKTLKEFQQLGWVILSSEEASDFYFTIKESIHRLASLYEHEIANFDQFVDKYHQHKLQ